MRYCSVCRKEITKKEPAVLVMSAFANPKYICEECEDSFDKATLSRDPEEINYAIEEIGKRLVEANNDDKLILDSVSEILEEAAERGALISSGDYDFSNDESEEADAAYDVPEELRESDEDKALDEEEKTRNKKFDKITNIICASALALALGFVIYKLITTFF